MTFNTYLGSLHMEILGWYTIWFFDIHLLAFDAPLDFHYSYVVTWQVKFSFWFSIFIFFHFNGPLDVQIDFQHLFMWGYLTRKISSSIFILIFRYSSFAFCWSPRHLDWISLFIWGYLTRDNFQFDIHFDIRFAFRYSSFAFS